jgi:hypothetical protein
VSPRLVLGLFAVAVAFQAHAQSVIASVIDATPGSAVLQFLAAYLGGWTAGVATTKRAIEAHAKGCPARAPTPRAEA